jgi:hypothetical protein
MSRDSPFWKPRMAAALHSTGATSDVLRGCLRTEMIGPLPLLPPGRRPPRRRPTRCSARSWPSRISPGPSTARPGYVTEKPWYYEHESRPYVAVTGARLSELIGR